MGLRCISNKELSQNKKKNNMIYELTESQMDGMGKMYSFFTAPEREGMDFKVDIGPTHGSVHIATLSGAKIGEYLNGVYGEGKYGPDGRDILNGLRKVYMEGIKGLM